MEKDLGKEASFGETTENILTVILLRFLGIANNYWFIWLFCKSEFSYDKIS